MHRVALSAPPPGLLVFGVKVLQPHVFRHDSWPIGRCISHPTIVPFDPVILSTPRHRYGERRRQNPNCTLQPIRHNVRRHRLQCWRRRTQQPNIEFRRVRSIKAASIPARDIRSQLQRGPTPQRSHTDRLNAERMQQLASVRTDHRIRLKMGAIRWQEPLPHRFPTA